MTIFTVGTPVYDGEKNWKEYIRSTRGIVWRWQNTNDRPTAVGSYFAGFMLACIAVYVCITESNTAAFLTHHGR